MILIPKDVEQNLMLRAKFLMEDEAGNVRGTTGYECWRDDGKDGFLTRFRKLNPQFFYRERKVTNKVTTPGTGHLIPAGKYTRIERGVTA